MIWHIGQRVAYTGHSEKHAAEYRRRWRDVVLPTVGCVYTIRDIVDEAARGYDGLFFRLTEVANRPLQTDIGPYEPAFHERYFRPLDERRLDVFRAHLNRVPAPEKEPA